jgi:transcriptional regulator with XRE-family HTH domain
VTPFEARLEEALRARGWRQRDEVAAAAGLTPRRLSRLARGHSEHGPTLAEVEALAAVLGVRCAWLCGWSS